MLARLEPPSDADFGLTRYAGNRRKEPMIAGGEGRTKKADAWGLLLPSSGEAAVVGNGDAEVLVGIHRSIVDADFVVQVGTG